MAFVKREYRTGAKYNSWVWREELSKAEKVRANYRLATYAVAIPALIATFAWGENDKQLSEETQKVHTLTDAKAAYNDASVADKFKYSYLSPLRTESETTHAEGHGIAEVYLDDFKKSYVLLGRSCLRDSAYDITGNSDKQSAAALGANGNLVTVYATGTDAPSLQFKLNETGILIPSDRTAETLEAYNCSYLDEVPVRSTFIADSEDFSWDQWQLEESIK